MKGYLVVEVMAKAEYSRWLEYSHSSLKTELLKMNLQEIVEAFGCDLKFGTGGLRGQLGAGTNRMNVHVVERATQGLADYLNSEYEQPSVAIARDSRNMGEEFVRAAASVLAANGVKAYVYPRIEPTPALSFAVRELKCSAGICVTASHNPSSYNGYKVYDDTGCQITDAAASLIQAAIMSIDAFRDVKSVPFDEGLNEGLISWIGEDVLDEYVAAIVSRSFDPFLDERLSVVYTPLNGSGLECVTRVLAANESVNVFVVPEQKSPDGSFPTCPYPNPEERQAMELGLELCEATNADLLLATDPDADRVGVAIRHEDSYTLLTGNEIGLLLADYIVRMMKLRGNSLNQSIVVTTIVSSAMIDRLAFDHGFEVRRTLTGFKYIGEQINILESDNEGHRFILGFEESFGYLHGSHVRDKDAVSSSMLICQMAQFHKSEGRDLVEAMSELYDRYGYFKNDLISVEYPGADGPKKMSALIEGLRQNPPDSIAGLRVEKVIDYSTGAQMPVVNTPKNCSPQFLPPANVLEYRLEGDSRLMVRPSGTEPKVKAYVFSRADSEFEASTLLDELKCASRDLFLSAID